AVDLESLRHAVELPARRAAQVLSAVQMGGHRFRDQDLVAARRLAQSRGDVYVDPEVIDPDRLWRAGVQSGAHVRRVAGPAERADLLQAALGREQRAARIG